MILILPIGVLLAAALAISILDRVRPKYGTSWLIAAGASVIAWVTIFILRLWLPTSLEIFSWDTPGINLLGQFSLLLDYDSWPYSIALITLTLAVILTDAARTRYDSTPRSWSISLVITALGLLALQSGTSLTLMISWVIIDIFELIYLLSLERANRFNQRIVVAYSVRTTSILMLLLGTSLAWQNVGVFDLANIPPDAAFFFFVAAGLRLGVFPLNLPFLQEPALRRGAGNIIRLAPAALSLALLTRLNKIGTLPLIARWMPLFQALLAIAAMYAAIRWLTAADAIEERPFWIVAWAALAAVSVLNGMPRASTAWGIALLLPGSLLFLYFPRIQRMNFLLYFGLIGLVGLPFTPIASGWAGFVANGFSFWTVIFLLSHTILLLGYLNQVIQPGGEAGALESWARLVYPLGLIIILQGILAIGLIGWPGSLTLGVWWLPLISTALAVSVIFFIQKFGVTMPYVQLPSSSGITKALNWLLPRIEPVFRLEWIYRAAWQLNNLLSAVMKGFSTILEGEGGVLWTILLLILIISIFSGSGVQ